MKIDEIKLLYGYNDWADARLLAACARVSPEQYAAPTSYGHGGLRATMVHILDNIWQQRITLQGYYKEPLADEATYDATELHEDAFPTLAVLRERWVIENMQKAFDNCTEYSYGRSARSHSGRDMRFEIKPSEDGKKVKAWFNSYLPGTGNGTSYVLFSPDFASLAEDD